MSKSNERTSRRFRRFLPLIILVTGCGCAFSIAWQHYCRPIRLTDEQRSLVHGLVERADAAHARSARIRIAIFHAQIPGSDPTAGLGKLLDSEPTCTWESLGPLEIEAGALRRCDVMIFPGGGSRQQAAVLGREGMRAVTEFVRGGGGYVGICAGAVLATATFDWSLALINAKAMDGEEKIPGVGVTSMGVRPMGMLQMELTDVGQRVFADLPRLTEVKYAGGPILSPAERNDLPDYVSLAVYRTERYEYEQHEGTMIGTPAIVAGRYGDGRVIIFSPHPEASAGLEWLVARAAMATARLLEESDTPKRRGSDAAVGRLGLLEQDWPPAKTIDDAG